MRQEPIVSVGGTVIDDDGELDPIQVSEVASGRRCGDCTLCCKLLPVVGLKKLAGMRCVHQRAGKGCTIYERRPHECQWWNCRWLAGDGTEGVGRPDRVHYVVDMIPDYVHQLLPNGERTDIPVLQIWVDPNFRDAWKTPACLAYIERMAAERRMAAIIRFGSGEAITVFAPPWAEDGQWHFPDTKVLPEGEAGLKSMRKSRRPSGPPADGKLTL